MIIEPGRKPHAINPVPMGALPIDLTSVDFAACERRDWMLDTAVEIHYFLTDRELSRVGLFFCALLLFVAWMLFG